MARVLITHGIPDKGLSALHEHDLCYPGPLAAFTKAEMLALLPQVEAILACGAIDEEMIAAAPRLRIISNYGAGYDRVDVAAATRRRIPVTNIPDATALPTAEIAIGLLLCCLRKISYLNKVLRTDAPEGYFGMGKHMGTSLGGLRLGIIGMGRIGGYVADFGRLMDMDVVYYNRHILEEGGNHGAAYMALDPLLASSDVVSVHCPLTAETINLLSQERLSLMKPTAYLINTARGAIVDYDALEDMLRTGRLAGAGLDVFHQEPHIPKGLLALDNVVLTPHIGTNTENARERMAQDACLRIVEALAGRRPPNVVNPEIYEV